MLITPRPSRSVRMKSADVERRLAEEFVAALLLQHQQLALDGADARGRDIAVFGPELGWRCRRHELSVARRSFRSSSRSPCSSATLKTMLSTPSCVSLRSSRREKQQRPHLRDGGADRMALLAEHVPEDDREAVRLIVEADLLGALDEGAACASPGCERPARSPLTSARNTAVPALEKPSASSCSETVLPLPVAPAMSPWRLPSASVR